MRADEDMAGDRADCVARIASIERRMRELSTLEGRRQIIRECHAVGCASHATGALDLMEKCFGLAIDATAGCFPDTSEHSREIFTTAAACHNSLGLRRLAGRHVTDAERCFDEAIRLRRELTRLFPDDRENHVYLGNALCNRGHASAAANADVARSFYEQSLAVLRQPDRPCECSYWDPQRQTWWCEQLEALGEATGAQWVSLAPSFIDEAMEGLRTLSTTTAGDT